jgi:hypothetical protein
MPAKVPASWLSLQVFHLRLTASADKLLDLPVQNKIAG